MSVRRLNDIASGVSAVYRIAFTGLLLYELVRYQLQKRKHRRDPPPVDRRSRPWGGG